MNRPTGRRGWNVWRGVVGGFYLLSALLNGAYTLPRAGDEEIFDGYANGAWFGYLEDFMRDTFVPNATVFMVLVIIFEVAVGLAILARNQWVDLGVIASLGWVVAVMPFLEWPYLSVNIVLFVMQAAVALRRYDTEVWRLRANGRPQAA